MTKEKDRAIVIDTYSSPPYLTKSQNDPNVVSCPQIVQFMMQMIVTTAAEVATTSTTNINKQQQRQNSVVDK